MKQSLAVWYKSPDSTGPKLPTTFTKTLTDEGLIFDITTGVNFKSIKENSLGILMLEGDDVVASATWRDVGLYHAPIKGDTVHFQSA
jgi:hypothetical protein